MAHSLRLALAEAVVEEWVEPKVVEMAGAAAVVVLVAAEGMVG